MNPQEQFWQGDFGDQYVDRNHHGNWWARVPFWAQIIGRTRPLDVFEIGCNVGSNLIAIRALNYVLAIHGCDINEKAVREAQEAHFRSVSLGTVFDTAPHWQADLVFTAGVLIHIAPTELEKTMRRIVQASRRYVLAIEYYSEVEQEIEYRGHAQRLWKRPFGKLYEAMGLRAVAMGPAGLGFDNCIYWLFEKP